MWWKKNKWRLLIPLLVVTLLAGTFYYGGNAPGARGWGIPAKGAPAPTGGEVIATSETPAALPSPGPEAAHTPAPATTAGPEHTPSPSQAAAPSETPAPAQGAAPTDTPAKPTAPAEAAKPSEKPSSAPAPAPAVPSPTQQMVIDSKTGKDKYLTDPVPEGKPLPVEPQDVKIGKTAYSCTLSISCLTILDNMDLCSTEKVELVPGDGWVLKPVTVTFYEGESVFNVLQRTCKQLKIHMEYESTPIYNSAYIEGIHNLYEFDVGELSGWMYKVNGWFPNYGCSRYQLKDGDVIDWVYTCDLGDDVGGRNIIRG
jgi:hypothetical protein